MSAVRRQGAHTLVLGDRDRRNFPLPAVRLPFKTGYKTGAILSAVSLSLSMALVQLMVYVFSIYSMIFFALLLIPLWIFIAFHLRRAYMIRKIKRRIKSIEKQSVDASEASGFE